MAVAKHNKRFGKERIKEKINRNPDSELYKQSADKADEVIDDLDIEFMPPVKEKLSWSKEQQRTKEPQKSKPKRKKGQKWLGNCLTFRHDSI